MRNDEREVSRCAVEHIESRSNDIGVSCQIECFLLISDRVHCRMGSRGEDRFIQHGFGRAKIAIGGIGRQHIVELGDFERLINKSGFFTVQSQKMP